MNVVLYQNFAKKENSTLQPTGTGTTFDCKLKDATGVLSPQLEFHFASGNPGSYNYARINTFGRYYFIREWTYDKGIWIAQLEVDVLATWKTYIGTSSAYILRSADTTYWNKEIIDNKYPAEGVTRHLVTDGGNDGPWGSLSFTIGTVGDPTGADVTSIGGVNYYCVDSPVATNIFKWLTGHGVNSYINDLNNAFNNFADDLFLATYDPVQYITTVKFFPFSVSGTTAASKFVIGKVSYQIANLHTFIWPVRELGPYTLSIPKHPDIASRGLYLSTSPYSVYVFELQPYGRIEIDGSLLALADTLSYKVQVDHVSGDSLLYLTATGTGYSASLGVYPAKVGTDIQIAQITSNIVQTATTESIRAAESAMTDNWFGVVDAAIKAGTDSKFKATIRGAEGSFLASAFNDSPKLHLYYKDVPGEDKSHFGVPVCRKMAIGSSAGYTLCADGDVTAPATKGELEQINGYMTAGFFYE